MIRLIMYPPTDPGAQADLTQQTAAAHADTIFHRLQKLPASAAQKQEAIRIIEKTATDRPAE